MSKQKTAFQQALEEARKQMSAVLGAGARWQQKQPQRITYWTSYPWKVDNQQGFIALRGARGEPIAIDLNESDMHVLAAAPELYDVLDDIVSLISAGQEIDPELLHQAKMILDKAAGVRT